jgi:hypothetical protein
MPDVICRGSTTLNKAGCVWVGPYISHAAEFYILSQGVGSEDPCLEVSVVENFRPGLLKSSVA